MSNNVSSGQSSKVLFLASFGLFYLYFTLSFKCILSGLPVLIGLCVHWLIETQILLQHARIVLVTFVFINLAYFISLSSYILYPICAATIWTMILGISCYRFEILNKPMQFLKGFGSLKVREIEDKVNNFRWPILDFDGKGILAFTGSTLDLSQMSFHISGIDFSFEVDAHTKIIARVENFGLRLGRDVTIKEIYANIRGDGIPASEAKSFSTLTRTNTNASVASRVSVESTSSGLVSGVAKSSPLRKLPPLPSNASTSSLASPQTRKTPPPLPPRLPPRSTSSSTIANELPVDDTEEAEIKRAIAESLTETSSKTPPSITSDDVGPSVLDDTIDTPVESMNVQDQAVKSIDDSSLLQDTASRPAPASATSFLSDYDDADDAGLRAALEESAIHHATSIDNPDNDAFDMKAAIAASLKDQTAHHKKNMRERRIKLSELLAKIPWWMKVTPGPLLTRLILSPIIWLHPTKISSVAATGTGKRITNLLEVSGLKKAHPNQEIFKLIRKVFIWLESGDISIVLNDISIRPHIPLSADHDVRIDLRASEPTMYRTNKGKEEILAKIHAVSASLSIPVFLLPNHEGLIPSSPRSSVPITVLLSLPGVFNRELLTIAAAFIKATTMMDLRHTAQSRPAPTLPSLSRNPSSSPFSFKSLGLAVKQAAGDLAKQKGVEWVVRDAEIAKWTAKVARLMSLIKVDVGGQAEIPVDLLKLRRAATERLARKESSA